MPSRPLGWYVGLVRAAEGGCDPTTDALLAQHLECAHCSLDTPAGQLHFRPGDGVFPGSSVATDLFNRTYWREVAYPWSQECRTVDDSFCTTSTVTGEPIDLSSTLFVDDTAKRVAGSTLGEVNARAERVEQAS